MELPKELTKASQSSEVNATLSHLKSLSLHHPENSRLLSCVRGWAPVFSGTHLVHSPGPLLASRGWPSGWGGEGAISSREPRVLIGWFLNLPCVLDLDSKGNKRPSHCQLRTCLWGLLHLSTSAFQLHKLSCY